MAIRTQIEWCDSTVNAMAGCDGCELWIPKAGVKDCYAGVLTERYKGGAGWPASFGQPQHFPGRIEAALRWPGLTGTKRADKPWLDGMPRLIFLDDMGDTFTESLDVDWLLPFIEPMALSPHIWIFLTKRPRRMCAFFERVGNIPANFWLGTTVTGPATLGRLRDLDKLRDIGNNDNILWCSFEPLMAPIEFSAKRGNVVFESTPGFVDDEPVDFDFAPLIDWAVVGGGSHMQRKMRPEWAYDLIYWLDVVGIPTFFKQWGDLSVNPNPGDPTARENGGYAKGGRMIDEQTLSLFPKVISSHGV